MGLGRRTFAPGEVLTASNVMNYLMDQSVMNFAGSAARGSAIGTAIQTGMVSSLNDTKRLEIYDGANWIPLGPDGRIVQIQSGSTTTTVNNATTTMVDTGLTVTITPQYSNSKLIVLVFQNGVTKTSGGAANCATIELQRNGTTIETFAKDFGYTGVADFNANLTASYVLYETAGTTSALTYKTRFRNFYAVSNVTVQDNSLRSTITAIEVKA